MSDDVATKILTELQTLRREVSFLMPTESLEEYENTDEITTAYDEAKAEFDVR